MENLFYGKARISAIFDLKGNVRNRHVQSTGKENEVLLDQNLIENIDSPLYVRDHSKKLIRSSIYNDTLFLSRLNIMDYSLLVGVNDEDNSLVLGIVGINYLYRLPANIYMGQKIGKFRKRNWHPWGRRKRADDCHPSTI